MATSNPNGLRSLLSLAGLLFLLAGVPLLLAAGVGWPLPRSMPSWNEFREALTGSSVSDETILKAIALAGWLAWAQIVTSAIVETSAWLKGRTAVDVPFAGALQPLVRQLLLSVLMVIAGSRIASLSHQPAPAAMAVLAVSTSAPAPAACEPTPAVQAPPAAPLVPPVPTYTVKARDSLWKVAEKHLGDGLRWREIWELNRGTQQSDGRALEDPNLVRPGWILRLPPDATNLEAPPPVQEAAPPTVDAAPVTAPPPLEPTLVPESGSVGDPAPPTAPVRHRTAAHEEVADGGSVVPAPLGIAGAGLLAAGIVAAIDRLRRAQIRRRRPGHGIPLPRPEAAEAENLLRSIATLNRAERINLAVRALTASLAQSAGARVPPIQAVLAGEDIEFLFADPVHAKPGPFNLSAGGRAWTLPGSTDATQLESVVGDGAPLAPALVSIGRIDDRELLIDLEAFGITAVTGGDSAVDAMLWTIAAGLATSRWADDVRVVAVGDVVPGFDRLERVERLSAEDASRLLAPEASATAAELAEVDAGSTAQARAFGGSWTPTIVVVARDAAEAGVEGLTSLGAAGSGFVAVLGSESGAADRVLKLDEGIVTLEPLNLVAAALELPPELRDAVGELVDLAVPDDDRRSEPVLSARPPERVLVDHGAALDTTGGSGAVPDGALLVRVLGPVEVEAPSKIDRRKSEELVVYLALHPDGADEQTLKTALWPDTAPSPHTFNQVVSRARICLGTAPDETHYLPRFEGGLYRLNAWVTTDMDRIEIALRNARAHGTEETIEQLAAALRLVRGQPFQGLKAGYTWAHSNGSASRAEILAADAAHLLAERHLDRGETTAALWAAAQGLLASPGDEALYRDRMLAYSQAGNSSAVETVMRELCTIAESAEPYDALHPETVELYKDLSRKAMR